MASLSFSPLPPPPATTLAVGAVPAVTPAAFVAAELAELPLPAALASPAPAPGTPAAPTGDALDGAAMRPDQLAMARQLSFQRADAEALGSSWRAMVRHYGRQLEAREQQALDRQLPAAVLLAAQHGKLPPQPDPRHPPADAWRFTVHAGSAQAQHLNVIAQEGDTPPGRRRRGRASLRLELELPDGTRVTVQLEPVPGGVALELCAPDAGATKRLRALQPLLERAVQRAGLLVQRWSFRDHLPAAPAHASIAYWQAESVLTLPVFKAVAELALLLPRAPEAPGGA
ncbi:hypothetical protein IM543_07000 [Massilia sp. UMI-21]|nr:hypothetical protein IM543_07000 [Massilia sp. UMI-21]